MNELEINIYLNDYIEHMNLINKNGQYYLKLPFLKEKRIDKKIYDYFISQIIECKKREQAPEMINLNLDYDQFYKKYYYN